MMKNLFALCLLALTVVLVTVGCSGGDDNGVPSTVTNELQSLSEAARKAGGDYSKLSSEDQQKFIARTGSEEGAKAMVERMATPRPAGSQ